MGGRVSQGGLDGCVHIAVFKMENQQGPIVSMGNSAQCYVAAWMGGELGGEWIRRYMAEFHCCLPETITILLISYIQNKKLKKATECREI